jgi:hypothetical protein
LNWHYCLASRGNEQNEDGTDKKINYATYLERVNKNALEERQKVKEKKKKLMQGDRSEMGSTMSRTFNRKSKY